MKIKIRKAVPDDQVMVMLEKKISTHHLTVLTKRDIPTLEQRKRLAITLWIWIGRRKYHEYPEIYTEISGSNQ